MTLNDDSLRFPTDAARFLPQRPPMRLIDEALSADDQSAESLSTVKADSLLLTAEGRFPALGLIEVMAQTIGIFAGRLRFLAGEEPRPGLLLGTRRITLERAVWPVGTVFRCRAEKTFESDEGLWQFDCRVEAEIDGERVPAAEARLTVYNPPASYFEREGFGASPAAADASGEAR